ncbi:protein AKNAD1 [Clarias magur]|uniref:Protein AKNAD1 n=1 Tax=Clarias magur TaxID=1594786 RepID=A0A8J4UA97_CLAMG|nr:protein AKNAD1 [Clarias magur]
MGEDNTDVKEDFKERTSVLWEKQFQQTIFVDISDNDDGLHFSHLQSSITMHVSHSLAASSENPGLSGSSKFVEDSSKNSSYISSNNRHYSNISKLKGNEMKVSVSQPHTLPEQMRWTHEEDNTSDEDQEELPYDGGQQYLCSNSLRQCNHSLDAFTIRRSGDKLLSGGIVNTICRKPVFAEKLQASIPDFLCRHLSYDELNCGRLIEAETMPEVSLMDSINETTRRTSPKPHSTTGKHSTKFKTSVFVPNWDENLTTLEVTDSKVKSAGTETHDNSKANKVLNHSDFSEKSKSYSSSSIHSSPGALLVATEVEEEVVENILQQSCSVNPPKLHEIDARAVKCSLGRTSSCNEFKYGQGQVHYPLPDFSKVAPKIKFPKNDGVSKPDYVPVMNRAQTTQDILSILSSPCKADVISRVLEDSDWLPEKPKMDKDEMLQSIFDQELQKQYFTETLISKFSGKKGDGIQDRKDDIKAVPHTFLSTKEGFDEKKRDKIWSCVSEQKSQTEGYRLTVELKDIINHFKVQVEKFEICINNMSMTVEEQKTVFKRMMEAQDQLERNYMTKKEEHRTLELQNYMGFKRNTGKFDPDRLVEGEIFKLGLHLEDIKEQIDRNAYRALSPSPSTAPASPLHEAIYNQISFAREVDKISVRVSEEEDDKGFQVQLSNSLSTPQHQRSPISRCHDTEDWITSDAEHRLEKGADCDASVDSEVPDIHRSRHAHSRHNTNRMSHDSNYSFPVSLQNLAPDTFESRQGDHYRRASIAPTINITSNTLGNITSFGVLKSRKNRNIDYMKPSYSLPFSFKIQDQQSEPGVASMKCSFQSDSALRPNNIYFYRTESVVRRVKDH